MSKLPGEGDIVLFLGGAWRITFVAGNHATLTSLVDHRDAMGGVHLSLVKPI